MNNRIDWIDIIRGIAIILVIMGHFQYSPDNISLRNAIYVFHMSMFFVLAGCTAELSMRKSPSIQLFIKNKIWALFIPYTIWSFLPLPLAHYSNFLQYDFYQRFIIYISGRCNDGGCFWFLICLFVFQLLFCAYTWFEKRKVSASLRILLVCITFTLIFVAKKLWSDDGFGFGLACQTYLFFIPFLAGVCIIKYEKVKNILLSKWFLTLFVMAAMYFVNIKESIPHSAFLSRLTGIGITCLFISIIERQKLSQYRICQFISVIGKYSLAIYIFHYLFLDSFNIISFFNLSTARPTLLFCFLLPSSIIISILCICISKVIETSPILSLYMLGKNTKKAQSKKQRQPESN